MAGWQIEGSGDRIELRGELGLADAAAIWRALRDRPAPRIVDVSRATAIDGAVMALLADVTRGAPCELVGATPPIAALAHLYLGERSRPPVLRREAALERLGGATRRLAR
ncbi:MAG TPA: STAS domain-containing protein, partial [Kofleriaceae bacterium]|nr:STAS domain-containing protein [Kofleriaceae bacterium]